MVTKPKLAAKPKPKPKAGPAPKPAPIQLPPSKLTICQYGFAFLTLKGNPTKLKVTGNSNPNVTPHPSSLPGGSVIVIVAGQNFGTSVITISGLLWTPAGDVPFVQKITVSVVLCPKKLPPPPPPPPTPVPVVGPGVQKNVCEGKIAYFTLHITLNGARVGLIHVTVV